MKYKSMGWMVCFSFMVDGVEDTWLFMCSKIQSTDLNGNQVLHTRMAIHSATQDGDLPLRRLRQMDLKFKANLSLTASSRSA